MKTLIFKTNNSIAPLFLRLFLAIVLFPHGAQKLLGWFTGFGFEGTMKYFTGTVGLPWPIGLLVIIIEFFGPLALLFGFATRLWSISIIAVMAGVIVTTFNDYFFMDWFGNHKAEGMEFFLLAIGIASSLTWSGAGKYSVDGFIAGKLLDKTVSIKPGSVKTQPVLNKRNAISTMFIIILIMFYGKSNGSVFQKNIKINKTINEAGINKERNRLDFTIINYKWSLSRY